MFNNLWSELEAEAQHPTEKGVLKRLIGEGKVCPMFLGIRKPEMSRSIILQVPKDLAPLPEQIPESKGFSYSVQISDDEMYPEHVSIILSSTNAYYNDIFSSIAEDLYSATRGLDKKKSFVSTFLDRVRLWQIFFEKVSCEGLSDEAQKGLYGELYFLNNYVLRNDRGYDSALRCWTGPRARQHDFQFGNLSVEVKTTSAKQHQKLSISSEQQLDETLVDQLYLFYLSISIVENGDKTLPALVDVIRGVISKNAYAVDLFNNALLQRGYLDVHSEKYIHTGYSIRDTRFFHVIEEFPRIREDDLRNGVGDVKYSISVASCSSYGVNEADFIKKLEESYQ